MLGLEFNSQVLQPAIVAGVAAAGLYGILAVAIVLTYRVSRTIAFLHGGLALFGAFLFWWLTGENNAAIAQHPEISPWLGLLIVVSTGSLMGAGYGTIVMSKRMANYPRVMLTTFSLAIMLILAGTTFTVFEAENQSVASPFGNRSFQMFDTALTIHQIMVLVILAAVVILLGSGLKWTRAGIWVRAIADSPEASRAVGVPLSRVGIGVYALTGALAALGGALLTPTIGTDAFGVLFIFLRALIVCVVGAFGSVSLALLGALLLGVVDSLFRTGVFGPMSSGAKEILVVGFLFAVVVAINHFGKQSGELLQAEGM